MKVLVTGGGGFLGGAVVRLLKQRGDDVRSFTRSVYPWLTEFDVEQVLGDLADRDAVDRAVEGCDVVFHAAAKAGIWGRPADYHATNVTGTENVLAACKAHRVGRLIYTSTPSVVHGGGDLAGVDESTPYPKHFDGPYPESKAKAERLVLAANGPDLRTVSLRPHLVWGPGDPHLVPRIVSRAKSGKLRRIGRRAVTVDVTYVDNAADAHVLAADALNDPGSPAAGKAYFVSNGEPVDLWGFVNRVLAAADEPPVTRTVSAWAARLAGRWFEWVYRVFRLAGEPPMTRFVAAQLSTSHWYDIGAARRDLGYEPRVSIDDGLRKLEEWFRSGGRPG